MIDVNGSDPDTGGIDPAQIPGTLSEFLIGLTAEFTQEGALIHSAETGNMGGELHEILKLYWKVVTKGSWRRLKKRISRGFVLCHQLHLQVKVR